MYLLLRAPLNIDFRLNSTVPPLCRCASVMSFDWIWSSWIFFPFIVLLMKNRALTNLRYGRLGSFCVKKPILVNVQKDYPLHKHSKTTQKSTQFQRSQHCKIETVFCYHSKAQNIMITLGFYFALFFESVNERHASLHWIFFFWPTSFGTQNWT